MRPQDRTRAILRSTLDAESRLVAVALADHMDAHDEAYPSVATLAAETALAERTVQSVIAHGLAHGWMAARGANGSRRTLSLVWAALLTVHPKRDSGARKSGNPRTGRTGAPAAPVHGAHPSPARGAPVPPQGAHPRGARGAPEACTDEATTEAPNAWGREPTPMPHAPAAPAPLRPLGRVDAAPALTLTVSGRTLPTDLPALMSGGRGPDGHEVDGLMSVGRVAVISQLLGAGIEDTATLLTIPAGRLKYNGVRDTVAHSIGKHLRARWGVELGALAEPEPARTAPRAPMAAPSPALPPIRPGSPRQPGEIALHYLDRMKAETAAGIRDRDGIPISVRTGAIGGPIHTEGAPPVSTALGGPPQRAERAYPRST